MKTSKTLQLARDHQDDDTATEQRLLAALETFERLVWRAAGDGEISSDELTEIVDGARLVRAMAKLSLERNRLVASLLCAAAGGLDLNDERTLDRLPALGMLAVEEEEGGVA